MKDSLERVTVMHMSINGPTPHLDPSIPEGTFKSVALFTSENVRPHLQSGRADYVPCFFSEVPGFFRSGKIPLDCAFVHVSPPDEHGYCSLGVSVENSLAAIETARYVIAQINPNMPRTHGDGIVHISNFDAAIEVDTPIYEAHAGEMTDVDIAIGKLCAERIPDRATLQMGIGTIPNAVLAALTHHKDLGVHTELFSDGVLPLIESGVINNKYKKIFPGRTVGTFLTGTKNLWDFVHDNPGVAMLDVANVNDPSWIAKNPDVMAINSAIEVDLTGQAVADSIGTRIYSGVGGQMDFMRGAALSPGGKPMICMPSVTNKGHSKIVPFLTPGGGVVSTRPHVHYVITEYGVAELQAKTIYARAVALANIAHPDHRDTLFEAIRARFGKRVF